ncbi:hypothetical protein AGMMS49928_22570 [Spirochaetia bacterium]|nr:hypothetical protein AGMMS49928_22570 [Spirochaetia bacterium]
MIKKYLYDNFIVILFLLAGFMVLAITIYTGVFVSSLSTYFRDSIDHRLRFISRSAARLVTAEELAELTVPEDMEKPLFADVRNRLIAFGEEADVKFVYFFRPLPGGLAQFIVDNDLSEETVNLGTEPLEIEDAVYQALEGETVVTGLGVQSPGYTSLLTSFSPIFGRDGAVVALVGVDIPDEQIIDTRNHIIILSCIIFISTALVIFVGVTSFSINKKKQSSFYMQVKQQELMSELSRSFIATGDASSLITGALRITGEFLNVGRMLIGVAEANSGISHAAYVWSSSRDVVTAPDTEGLNDLINSSFPQDRPEIIPTVCCDDIRMDTRYNAMNIVGIRAFIWAPLYVEGRYWAVLSIEEFKTRQWTESDRQLVSTVSSVIAGAVERELREQERDSAREQAENANKAKSDFLANMSHEMRTPMNAIIGMTAIAKGSHDIEKKEYCLNKIENASTHLLGVINDILDMSKIEANRFDLSPIDFNFEKTLQKIVNVINFRVEEKHQNFSVHIDKNIPRTLYGDDQRLGQVIANLLSNAVKFTPDAGTVKLDAKLEKKDGDVCTLRISVTDSGIGLSHEQMEKLFSSFVQADSSTNRKFGGTGLGLAISKRIVEMMNGTIWVESELGKGAAFIFTAQVKEAAEEMEELGPVDWSRVKVLAVDDDPDIREYFSDIASQLGFACDTAGGDEEALASIEKNGAYDVYFVDYKMPGLGGIGLSRKIHETEPETRFHRGGPVIIMISSVDWNTIEAEAKQAGVDGFLSKPLFPSGIADCISRYLGSVEQTAAAVSPGEDVENCFAGRKILLAEDVDINREIVMTLLEPTGVTVDCAENGKIAVKMFEAAPDSYSMIFMDVQMPEMDGYEATINIREFEKSREPRTRVPIIAMTANVFKEDIDHCLAAGMDGHVGKPLNLDEVMDRMRQYLLLG